MARRSAARAALVGFCLLTLLFGALGIWQVERRVWKLDLIARVDARVGASPLPPPGPEAWAYLKPAEAEFRHVTITGRFDHARETPVQAVTERGPGFWILTPLRTDDGTTILTNRGFVPTGNRDPGTRAAGQVAEELRVTGLLRLSEPGGGFLRANDPAGNRWYSRDVAAIAAARGLGPVAPFFIDADATLNPGGLPIGGLTVVAFRNEHLVYALTWFALAGLSVGGIVLVIRHGTKTAATPPSLDRRAGT